MSRFLASLPLVVLVVACAGTTGVETPPPRASPEVSPSAPGATATRGAVTAAPADLQQAVVTNVVDGDTIDVLIGGSEVRVRYIGIDTPETVDPRRPVECFGRQAAERNRELVQAKAVGLERDVSETDRFGRLLRYIWADGRMVNATLVEEGYATAATFPPDVRYADLFARLEAEARARGRGLWGPACSNSSDDSRGPSE